MKITTMASEDSSLADDFWGRSSRAGPGGTHVFVFSSSAKTYSGRPQASPHLYKLLLLTKSCRYEWSFSLVQEGKSIYMWAPPTKLSTLSPKSSMVSYELLPSQAPEVKASWTWHKIPTFLFEVRMQNNGITQSTDISYDSIKKVVMKCTSLKD